MTIEPISQDQVDALARYIGPVGAMIARLDEVDISKGRGYLDANHRCLWTTDGRRITIYTARDGSVIASCAKVVDPEIGNNL